MKNSKTSYFFKKERNINFDEDWLLGIKEKSKEQRNNSKYKDQSLPPGFEIKHQARVSLFHPRPCCRGDSWLWLLGWQRSHRGAVLIELAGNPPLRILRKCIHEKVSHWRQSATKPPEGDASCGCWRLAGAGHQVQQEPIAREGAHVAGTGCWRCHACLQEFAARPHQNEEGKVLLPVMSLRCPSLTKLRIVPAGKIIIIITTILNILLLI